ncbi:MAG: LPS export ABC transporter ATP-binding protein [Gammaproteobacteria bacterium]|nr:LPS export ABC transporter ATP-binding protein [Gammaproteobacteria bacterium]CAJ2377080.1 MAG: lipopolysaccharide transport system ATP binding protein [Arenicellales bacterium IbO2]MDA7969322.1 LPS export ABC transporter ATP-binding protein [Gammaproteobacteria bacterium]MDA7972632.1 LPS export ABC transporter ATP-binding protein [Gammaproteobacteria bacterium]MDA7990212.1 LPS export ABC transporter ATP-binding protein [Gammaproteobacteria bacterium]
MARQTKTAATDGEKEGLRARGLVKKIGRALIVDQVDLDVSRGEVVGLLGPNGAGKTTSFNMIIGLVRESAGRVFLGAEDITPLPMHARARRGIGYLPQEHSVFRKLTAEENILAVLEASGPRDARERAEICDGLLDEFGIRRLRDKRAIQLSGGEQRRVEIARALALSPAFILLDEPFAGVDPIAVRDIQQIIRMLKKRGIGVLITDHNVRETLGICDRAYILHGGKVLVSGAPRAIMRDRAARDAYFGRDFRL